MAWLPVASVVVAPARSAIARCADPLPALQCLAPGDERREEKIAERAVLVQERPQRAALDRDVAQRLDDERADEHRLPGQDVQLPEEARGARV